MIKDVILELAFVKEVTEEGKSIMKTRRFNQVVLNITDEEARAFALLVSRLTGEVYVSVNKIEKKET